MNPQVLGTIEYMAKQQAQQAGVQFQPPQPQQQQQPPFTERPGNSSASLGQTQTPALTPQQRAMAQTFGMSEREYAESLRNFGGNR
jgi:phage I-like protein